MSMLDNDAAVLGRMRECRRRRVEIEKEIVALKKENAMNETLLQKLNWYSVYDADPKADPLPAFKLNDDFTVTPVA